MFYILVQESLQFLDQAIMCTTSHLFYCLSPTTLVLHFCLLFRLQNPVDAYRNMVSTAICDLVLLAFGPIGS